jgi:transcription antitermination factor NusG
MSTLHVVEPTLGHAAAQSQWYALQVRPRHEKKVVAELEQKGVNTFLPLVTEVRQWSDRRMKVALPLFSCYAFVNIVPTADARVVVRQSYGVLNFVGNGKEAIPIPESQIESIRRLVDGNVPFMAHPFLEIGQHVRVRGGALDGIEGILERREHSNQRLVISVQTIQRSLSISVEGYEVEPVGGQAHHA